MMHGRNCRARTDQLDKLVGVGGRNGGVVGMGGADPHIALIVRCVLHQEIVQRAMPTAS